MGVAAADQLGNEVGGGFNRVQGSPPTRLRERVRLSCSAFLGGGGLKSAHLADTHLAETLHGPFGADSGIFHGVGGVMKQQTPDFCPYHPSSALLTLVRREPIFKGARPEFICVTA